MLPDEDREYLAERFPRFSNAVESGVLCVVLHGFPLPAGLSQDRADLLLRLVPGYPDIPPDMWWFDPAVLRPDGRTISQTQYYEQYLGRTWQRWSRHLQPGQWRPGVDSLKSYLALVQKELRAAAS